MEHAAAAKRAMAGNDSTGQLTMPRLTEDEWLQIYESMYTTKMERQIILWLELFWRDLDLAFAVQDVL
jgi:hypothetical protein